MQTFEIRLDQSGNADFIYSDESQDLADQLGKATTARASHVEPARGGGWTADMSPVGGPMLGPFRTRADALKAEVAWLRRHHFKFKGGGQC